MNALRRVALAVLVVIVLGSALFADDDPPSRVARLKYIAGQVSLQPGGVDGWVPGAINRPLTTADRVWTDRDSRAELDLGTSVLRLTAETSLTLSNVSDGTVQVELDQGTLNLRIAHLYDDEVYEIDTPNLAFTVTRAGNYRFDVDSDGDSTQVTVWKGEGEATGEGPSVRVRSREQALFSGGRSLAHQMRRDPDADGFDDWCRLRDERDDHVRSARYVPRGVIGYEDLDDYGRWITVAPYGPMWMPAVDSGWAPYHYGHWIWVAPWGWTWVDDAPWGFAPFHYGRWVYYRGGWGWVPGPVAVRPYYAPALVAWVGGGDWSVGLSFGSGGGMAWVPLGYGEPYVPYYHASRVYFQNVNVTNTRITNITYVTNNYYNNNYNVTRIRYVNVRVNGAVTAAPRETIINSRPVDHDAVFVDGRHFRDASFVADPDMRPSRHSVLGPHDQDDAPRPPRREVERPVVSRITPPHPPRPAWGRDEDRPRDEHPSDRDGAGRGNRPEPGLRSDDSPGRGRDAREAEDGRRNAPDSVSRPDTRDGDQERGEDRRQMPRPPAGENARQGDEHERGVNPSPNPGESHGNSADNNGRWGRNVPRPPQQNDGQSNASNPPAGNTPPASSDNGRWGRNVPRPPERNDGQSNASNPPAGNTPPASSDNGRWGRNVPRPPERNDGQSNASNPPAGNTPPASSDNGRWGRNVPRPPQRNGQDAEVGPAAPANGTPAARDNGRPQSNVPRPPEGNVRQTGMSNSPAAPVSTPAPARDNGRPQWNAPRPPQMQSGGNSAPQRQAEPRPVASPSREPNMGASQPRVVRQSGPAAVREAPVVQRQAAPPASRPSSGGSKPAPSQQHGSSHSDPGKDNHGPNGKS